MAKLTSFETLCKNYFSSFEAEKRPFNFTRQVDVELTFTYGRYSFSVEFFYIRLSESLKLTVVYIRTRKDGVEIRNCYYKFYARHYIDKNFKSYVNNVMNLED